MNFYLSKVILLNSWIKMFQKLQYPHLSQKEVIFHLLHVLIISYLKICPLNYPFDLIFVNKYLL